MKKFLFFLWFFLISCSKQEFTPVHHTFRTEFKEQEITLSFDDKNRFFGKVINNYWGQYKIEQNTIKLTLQGSTMKMGLSAQIAIEEDYFKSLKNIHSFVLSNNTLILKGTNIEYKFDLLNTDEMNIH